MNVCLLEANSKAATCCIYLIHDTLDLQSKYLFHQIYILWIHFCQAMNDTSSFITDTAFY